MQRKCFSFIPLSCTILLVIYLYELIIGIYVFSTAKYSMALFAIISIYFFLKERKESILCPEILILPVFFIMSFYREIVLENAPFIVSRIYDQFTEEQYKRGLCVHMIAFFSLMIGESFISVGKGRNEKMTLLNHINLLLAQRSLIFLTLILILYSFVSGKMMILHKYDSIVGNAQNTYIVFITIALFVSTILEFARLNRLNVESCVNLFKNINKLYLILILFFAITLLKTGNRGEALLVIFPVLFSYSFLIRRISNKLFVVFLLIGIPIMVFIGLIRSGNTFSINEISVLNSFRDFGGAYLTQTGLIQYTDTYGILGLGIGLRRLFSSIPFLGGFIQAIYPSSYTYDDNSAILATNMFQLENNMDSGLGTSLVGDLYYSGGIIWVISYMIILGWFMSYCYKCINVYKSLGVLNFMIYIWLCSNSIYMMRAEWYSMFRYFGFSIVIILCLRLFFKK